MKKLVLIGSVAMALAACNSSDTADVRNFADPEVRESGIANTWKTECQNVLLDLFGVAAQTEEYRIGGDIRKVTTYYETNDCKDGVIEIQETGGYGNVEKLEDNQNQADVYKIDINWSDVQVRALNETGENLLSTVRFCGFEDWNTDQPQDVTGQTSENPVIDRCWTKTPRDQFDIFSVEGDSMYLGAGLDKSNPDNRPTAIDTSVEFKK